MAEIKSTLEMVMERAAKMGKASKDEVRSGEVNQEGMREAARYLREAGVDLGKSVLEHSPEEQAEFRNGMVMTLLRNIVLPREAEQQELAEKAIQGLRQVAQGSGDLDAVFGDMKAILGRYEEHRQQLRQQLEDQFAQQMQMMEQNLARQTGMSMKLEPSQHPKFQEEWQKLLSELNSQYGKAIEQHKKFIEQRLTL